MSGIDSTYSIGKWNGATWDAINFSSTFGGISSIGKFNNQLIAAGDFLNFNGNFNSKRIASYDGLNWDTLNAGITNGSLYYSIIEYNNDLIVGGDFNIVNNIPMKNLARWDGMNWYAFANVGGTFSQVSTMAIFNNELYIGGYFGNVNGQPIYNIAKFDGTTWSDVGGGLSSDVFSLVVDTINNRLYAAGNFTGTANGSMLFPSNVGYWDGNNWNAVGNGPSISPRAMIFYKNNLYAGFSFEAVKANGDTLKYLSKWDGTEWQPLTKTVNDAVLSFCVVNNDLVVGGGFTQAGDTAANYIAAYTDTTTSINEIQVLKNQIEITPNPSKDFITCSFAQPMFTACRIRILNLLGTEVFKQTTFIQKQFTVPVNALPHDVYVLEVFYEGKREYAKFVKE